MESAAAIIVHHPQQAAHADQQHPQQHYYDTNCHNDVDVDDNESSLSSRSQAFQELMDRWEIQSSGSAAADNNMNQFNHFNLNGGGDFGNDFLFDGNANHFISAQMLQQQQYANANSESLKKLLRLDNKSNNVKNNATNNHHHQLYGKSLIDCRSTASSTSSSSSLEHEHPPRQMAAMKKGGHILATTKTTAAVNVDDQNNNGQPTPTSPEAEANGPQIQAPAELSAFLSSPTGLNWEDLVRSMKKQQQTNRDGVEMMNKVITVVHVSHNDNDDDTVSELGMGDHGKVRVGGYRHRGFGRLEVGGSKITNDTNTAEIQISKQIQKKAGNYKLGCDPSEQHAEQQQEEQLAPQCTSTRLDDPQSLETTTDRKGDLNFDCNDDDPILGRTIGNNKKKDSSLHPSAQTNTSPSLCQAKSSPSSSSKRHRKRQGRSKSRDTLEQTIERVVTEQQYHEQQHEQSREQHQQQQYLVDNASSSNSPARQMPHEELLAQSPLNHLPMSPSSIQRIGSGLGSAFSPIVVQSPPNNSNSSISISPPPRSAKGLKGVESTPGTPGTVLETTFDHSSFFSSTMIMMDTGITSNDDDNGQDKEDVGSPANNSPRGMVWGTTNTDNLTFSAIIIEAQQQQQAKDYDQSYHHHQVLSFDSCGEVKDPVQPISPKALRQTRLQGGQQQYCSDGNSSSGSNHQSNQPQHESDKVDTNSSCGNTTPGGNAARDVNIAPRISLSSSSTVITSSALHRRTARHKLRNNGTTPTLLTDDGEEDDPPIVMMNDVVSVEEDDGITANDTSDDHHGHYPSLCHESPAMELLQSTAFTNTNKEVGDGENDSFYHQIRGSNDSGGGACMNPVILFPDDDDDVQIFENDDIGIDEDREESCVSNIDNDNDIHFPTSFDENMFDINESWGDDNIVNQAQHQDGIEEKMFDINESWVEDIVKQAQQQVVAATSNSGSTSNLGTRKKMKRSQSNKKKKHQHDALGAFPEQNLPILPESLSINRRDPTCWQMTLHRMSKTKGEF